MTALQQAVQDLLDARARLMRLLSGAPPRPPVTADDIDLAQEGVQTAVSRLRTALAESLNAITACTACKIEAEIGTEENPHPVPERFHTCVAQPLPTARTGSTP